jgi:hypothetical protein
MVTKSRLLRAEFCTPSTGALRVTVRDFGMAVAKGRDVATERVLGSNRILAGCKVTTRAVNLMGADGEAIILQGPRTSLGDGQGFL